MPHVLHIIEYLDKGGATRAALATAKQSARFGPYEHSIVSLKPAHQDALELAKDAGVTVYETPSMSTLDGLIDDSDILQIEYWNGPAINHFLHSSLPPNRLAIWFHVVGTSSPHRVHQKLVDLADMPMASAPTTFNDHPVFQAAIADKRTPEPVMVIGPADFDRVKSIELREHDGFNIGYIGTLSFVKLHKDFIPMSVNIEIPNSTFIVCGEGNEEELKKQAAALNGLDRFDFRGFVEDISSVMEIFDVYGYPLCDDTYAAAELNLQEVMYAGIPPIVFPHGGIKGLIQHNRTGLFVTNMEDYRRAIEYLYYNPVERKRLGVNAAAYARAHFGAKNAARSMNKVYEKLLALPKRYHTWGEEPQNFAPKLSQKTSGQKPTADIFMESMGIPENPFLISKHETDILKQLEADQQIGRSSYQVFNTGIYRYLLHTPSDPYMNLWAGLYLEENGNPAEALSTYASAISAGLTDWRVQWYLGRALKKLGKLEEAHKVYSSLHQNIPDFEVITQDSSFASQAETITYSKEATPLLDSSSEATTQDNKIRVSAIVSTYNAESFMEGCMANLVNQSLFKRGELEIVVIDACSQENEKAIVERFQASNDNITYIRTDQRETLYASWNRGIQVARGTYITSANTDDRHKQDGLEKLANYLDDYPDIALTYPGQIDTSVPNETFATSTSTKVLDWPVYTYEELEHHCIIGSQPMWRRSLHGTYGLFRDTFKSAGDYEFWLRVGKKEKFFRYPEILGLYYRNPEGIEHSSDTSKKEALQIWEEYGMFERGIPVILNGRIITSPDQVFPSVDQSPEETPEEQEPAVSPEVLPFDAYINQFEEQLVGSKFQHALDIAERAVHKYPDLPYAHILKAIALRQLQDYSNAIVSLEESIKIEETPEALVELVQLSLSTANLEEAYRTQIYIKENYPEWGQRLNGLNIPEPAEPEPAEPESAEPEPAEHELAELELAELEPAEHETSSEAETSKDHSSMTSTKLQGVEEVGDIIELISTEPSEELITIQLNTSEQSNPMSLPASIGDLDYTIQSFEELRDEFEKLIKLRDVQHAEELALAATRRFPENSEAWILKATSFRLKGSFEEAKEAIQQSLLIKDTPEALIELLELSISTGDDLEALHISEAIKSSYPEYRDYITQLLEKKTSLKTKKTLSLHPAVYNFAPIPRESKAGMKSNDICIVSFPGSGSSWLGTLLSDILQQSKGYSTKQAKLAVSPADIVKDLHHAFEENHWLTDHGYDFRLFKAVDIAGVADQKIVYVFGDPIASLISAYHLSNQVPYLNHLASSSCDNFCRANIDNYNLHLNTALILKAAHPDKVMLFSSKDLAESQLTQLMELHNFIDIPFSSSTALQALKNCDTEKYLSEKTQGLPITFSSLDYLQPGNEISKSTLDAILSRLMPVYQEACAIAEKSAEKITKTIDQPRVQERLTLSIPV